MAGLLDFLSSPEMQMGIGLLSAGGPRTDPNQTGLGTRLADAMGYAEKQKDMELKRKMAVLAEQRAQAAFKMQQEAYAGIPGASQGAAPASGGMGAPGGSSSSGMLSGGMGAPMGQGGGDTNAQLVRLEKMAIAGVPGAKEAFEIYKYRNDPQQLQPGTFSQNRVSGAREYIPDVKTGMGFGSQGMYALPGSEVLATLEGQKQGAIERAKAGLDFVEVPDGQGGKQMMPRAAAAQLLGGGAQPPRPATPATPAGYGTEVQMRGQMGGMGADINGITREIAMATDDLKKTLDPSSRKMLSDHITDLKRQAGNIQMGVAAPAAPPGQWGASLTAEQQIAVDAKKAGAIDSAKADVVRETSSLTDKKRYGQFSGAIDRAIDLLGQGPTASGIGSWADSAASFVGRSTKGADLSSQLNTVSGWLTSNVPRMEGPQSDRDSINYQIMSGMVGDSTKPVSQRMAAAKEVKALQDKYASLNGGAASNGATGDWNDKPAQPEAPTPMKGMVRKGYKFKGGDPTDKNNWEQM